MQEDQIITPGFDLIKGSINAVSVGSGPSEMLGRKITIKSIQYKMMIYMKAQNVGAMDFLDAENHVQVYIILDRQANGSIPSIQEIFQPYWKGTINTLGVFSHLNLASTSRFTILKKVKVSLRGEIVYDYSTTRYSRSPIRKFVQIYKKVNIPIEFASQIGVKRDISEIKSNNILVVAVGLLDSSISYTSMYGVSRIRYTDD